MSPRPLSGRRVAVLGGGLAGVTAALRCAAAGARVELYEARAWLGGATWSSHQHGLHVDNGQHVFLRCCTAYRELLGELGVTGQVHLQDSLAVPVAAPGGPLHWIRSHPLPAPAHLSPSLLRFGHLPLGARLRAARTARQLARVPLDAPASDAVRFGDWLVARGESDLAIERFWDLLIRPTLNLPARDASLALAAKVFQTGLLEDAHAADLGWSRVPLGELHGAAMQRALDAAGVSVRLRAPVDALAPGESGGFQLRVRGERCEAEAVVVALAHLEAAALLPDAAGVDRDGLRALGVAPIVNLHAVWSRRVMDRPFVATVGSPLQWIFDRSEAAGLAEGQLLAVSLSAADEWLGLSRDALRRRLQPDFEALFPAARSARLLNLFVTSEPAATFRQAPDTRRHRPGPRTALPGLVVAGAYTDTGWPATMEGAVRSGRVAAEALAIQPEERRAGTARAA